MFKMISIIMMFLFSMVFGSVITDVRVTNIKNSGFTISWMSNSSEVGSIQYGTGSTGLSAIDIRGAGLPFKLHYVNIVGLPANTTYNYDIVSGADNYNNGGSHFQVKTGPILDDPGFSDARTGKVYDEAWHVTIDVLCIMYIEDYNLAGSLGRSQIRSGLANNVPDIGWSADLANFRESDLSASYRYSNADNLVLDFYKENGTVTQLRLPLTKATANVSLVQNSFPMIDSFDNGSVSNWVKDDSTNLSMSATTNAYFSAKALQVKSPSSNAYFAGYISDYISKNQHLDPGQYNYLKVVFNNQAAIGTQLKIELFDNDTATYSASNAEKYVVTMNLLKRNVWKEVYVPLNNTIFKKSGINGDNIFNPYQILGDYIYPGLLMLGLTFVSTTATGSVDVLVDEIQLVTANSAGVDADMDGIVDSAEAAYSINASNILSDNDNDGFNNYIELVNHTNPTIANLFPIIDGFEGNGYTWVKADNINYLVVNTTDTSVIYNGSKSLHVTGNAAAYYAGFLSAWIQDGSIDWDSSYKSFKFLLKNQGQIGDKLKIQLQEADGDIWEFEQFINNVDEWHYYTILLSSFVDTTPAPAGDGVMDFRPSGDVGGIKLVGFALLSKTATGNLDLYIDSIQAGTIPTSDDNDGDGLPNTWETNNSLNPDSAASPNGALDDPDHDSFSNIDEYFCSLRPRIDDKFPIIDDFKGVSDVGGNPWVLSGLTATTGNGFMKLSGTASNWFGGYLSKYIGNYLFDWSKYQYIKIDIQNGGNIGDSVKVTIVDNDQPTHTILNDLDDQYTITFMLDDNTGITRSYYIPYPAMAKVSINSGNNIEDFAPIQPRYPGVMFIGFAFNSVTQNGQVLVTISKVELTTEIYDTTDTNSDSMPDWWCRLYGLSITANSGADSIIGDREDDGVPNLLEFMKYTDPLVKNSTLVDTDGDGMANNWETMYGLIPTLNDASNDPDGDSINNYREYLIGSSPFKVNTTYDMHHSIPDFWQLAYVASTNILNNPAGSDYDGDGISDYDAYLQGINPAKTRINLQPGWNLITLGVSRNYLISQIIASINAQNGAVIVTQAYKYESGGWVYYPGTDFNVSYGESVFFLSSSTGYYIPAGSNPSTYSYNFSAGWNSFGKSAGASYTAIELGTEINTGSVILEQISRYRDGAWTFYNYQSDTGTNLTIDKLGGFYLKFTSNYSWTPAR